jgi:hypothetical protein
MSPPGSHVERHDKAGDGLKLAERWPGGSHILDSADSPLLFGHGGFNGLAEAALN